jgi:hypothetical protein
MTSKEYYLDSTAHFAVHEVRVKKRKIFLIIYSIYLGIIKR